MSVRDFTGVTRRLQKEADQRDAIATGRSDSSRLIGSVQTQIEAIERGDYDAVLSQAHDDVTLDIFAPPQFSWIRQTLGRDELRRALEHNFDTLEGQTPTITQVFAEGETVVLFGREQGRIRATGERYDVEFVDRFTFRAGRLAANSHHRGAGSFGRRARRRLIARASESCNASPRSGDIPSAEAARSG